LPPDQARLAHQFRASMEWRDWARGGCWRRDSNVEICCARQHAGEGVAQ
jgi:hypothetical protein